MTTSHNTSLHQNEQGMPLVIEADDLARRKDQIKNIRKETDQIDEYRRQKNLAPRPTLLAVNALAALGIYGYMQWSWHPGIAWIFVCIALSWSVLNLYKWQRAKARKVSFEELDRLLSLYEPIKSKASVERLKALQNVVAKHGYESDICIRHLWQWCTEETIDIVSFSRENGVKEQLKSSRFVHKSIN